MRRGPIFTPAVKPQAETTTASAASAEVAPTGSTGDITMKLSLTDILGKILALIPVIAYGVQAIHQDLGSKTALAQDSLNIAIAGATAVASEADQQTVATLGAAAQNILTTTVTAIHNASQPVQPATPAPAAS